MNSVFYKILLGFSLLAISACGQLSENTALKANMSEKDQSAIEQLGTCAPLAIAGIWQFKSQGEVVKSFLYGPSFSSLKVKLDKFNKILSSDVKVVNTCEEARKGCVKVDTTKYSQNDVQCKHFGLRKYFVTYPDLKIFF
ncbi:MAG: hypothetical protein KBD78_04475 [Oligoflexales bacterium]|nr:hypothetical protein [Oligoflexales bacterium]